MEKPRKYDLVEKPRKKHYPLICHVYGGHTEIEKKQAQV